VGGSATSQHRLGEAADGYPLEDDIGRVFRWIVDTLTFGQAILENPTDSARPWLHLSLPRLSGPNQEALEYDGKIYRVFR